MPPRTAITRQSPINNVAKKRGNVIDRISPVSFDDEGIKILIFGRSKTGKTRLASTFPGPLLWIICSGGNKSGELRSVALEDRKKIKAVTLNNTSEITTLIEYAAEGHFKTVVQDHISGLQDKALSEILKVDEVPAQMKWGTATRDQYMEAGSMVREPMRRLMRLNCNVVVLGQERTTEPKDSHELMKPVVGVDIMPSLADWLYPTFDYICQTFKKQKTETKIIKIAGKDSKQTSKVDGAEFCLRTGPHEIYTNGFRLPKGAYLPDHIADPTYDKIMTVVRGEWQEGDARWK